MKILEIKNEDHTKNNYKDETNMNNIIDELLDTNLDYNKDKELDYCCCSCRVRVEIIDDNKGFCEFCECEVFIEKI